MVNLGDQVLSALTAGDYDFYSVTLGVDTIFELETEGVLNLGDTVVGIFTSDGSQMIGCDDDKPILLNRYSLFSCCLPPGTYCVGVKEFNPNAALPDYSIDFRNAGTCSANPDPQLANCQIENVFGGCVPF